MSLSPSHRTTGNPGTSWKLKSAVPCSKKADFDFPANYIRVGGYNRSAHNTNANIYVSWIMMSAASQLPSVTSCLQIYIVWRLLSFFFPLKHACAAFFFLHMCYWIECRLDWTCIFLAVAIVVRYLLFLFGGGDLFLINVCRNCIDNAESRNIIDDKSVI